MLAEAKRQLTEYFALERTAFDLPLVLFGTPFQQQVWRALQAIPYGTTVSYAAQAAMIGRPSAVRAVANANAANPLSVIIPCHRVVLSAGLLGGYSGGVRRKAWLLALEGASGGGGVKP